MKTRANATKLAAILGCLLLATLGYLAFVNSPFGIIARGNPNAGLWEDDPENWKRAFGQALPPNVTVIHSKYWESEHFTHEYMYFFVVEASEEWKAAFLKQRDAIPVASSQAWAFQRSSTDLTPDWFVPDPVSEYEVWDRAGHHGSIWINKTNGHIHFFEAQL